MRSTLALCMVVPTLFLIVGCGESGSGTDGGTGFTFDNPPPTTDEDCTTNLTADETTASSLNTAIEDASSGDVICLEPGTYDMDGGIFVSNASNLTVKGIGEERTDVLLDFAGAGTAKGFDVTVPGFVIENMHIKNTSDNGVQITADNTVENPATFRKMLVTWDAGSVTENGAYSIYPTKSKNVLVEYNEVIGASDAGLYVGQCEGGIVRHNFVHGNVAGLEVENSLNIEVFNNEVTDNSAGILALQEPGLERLENFNVLIRDNEVYENDRANFAPGNATVANIPPGTGLMALAGNQIEFRDNDVRDNASAGLLIVSNVTLCLIQNDFDFEACNPDDIGAEGYDPIPFNIYSNGDNYTDNGLDPQGDVLAIIAALNEGVLADVVFDGIDHGTADPQFCLGLEAPGFLNIGLPNFTEDSSTDASPYECELDPVMGTGL